VARKTRSIDCLASKLVGWEDRIIEGQAMSFATICRHDENFSHRKRTIRANERQLLSIRRKSGGPILVLRGGFGHLMCFETLHGK